MKIDPTLDLNEEPQYGFETIRKILPHRFPFLLVDSILKVVPGERIVALKNVSANEPYFAGHFPSQPIMPGVLMIESMAQAAILLYSLSVPETEQNKQETKYLGQVKTRFLNPVFPGDRLVFDLVVERLLEAGLAIKGVASVRGKPAMRGEMLVMGKNLNAGSRLDSQI